MAGVEIDSDIGRRLMRDPDVQAEVERRAKKVHATSTRLVHIDSGDLRRSLYVRRVGNTWHVGSNKHYALTEEFSDSPRYGGVHSYLRAALPSAGD